VGIEDDAINYLFEKARDEHQIRSAFTRGSMRGWIYLEAVMNPNLDFLLKSAPGIIRTHQDVVRHQVDFPDWTKLLTMKDPATIVEVGQWVRIYSGLYKGDFGFVAHLETWGVEVLLVPRLKAPNMDSSRKRKRTAIRPEPALFDLNNFRHLYGIDPKHRDDGSYTSRGQVFEHGLLRRRYDLHSLSSTQAGIPSNIFFLFQLSKHPAVMVSKFPCPKEWVFEEGDQVVICSSKKKAIVTLVETDHLEVDLATEEGNVAVSWHDVCKAFVVGDFISIASGPFQGTIGWIDHIEGDIAHVLKYQEEGNSLKPADEIMVFLFKYHYI
jgi:transcription antitermination factor NusG